MPEVIRIPKLGLSDFGELVSWEVKIGDSVTEGEIIAVLESEKASAEIQASAAGILLETYVEEGEEIAIEVGKPLCVVGEEGEHIPSLNDLEAGATEADQASKSDTTTDTGGRPSSSVSEADDQDDDLKVTPRARRRADEHGVTLSVVEGTGPQGAITTDDVDRYLESGADDENNVSATTDSDDDLTITESRKLSGIRKTIADRLSQSAREKPHVMGTREISIERLQDAQTHLSKEHDIDVSLNDLLVYLIGIVLQDLPAFNAHFEEGHHKLIEEVNIGYAVNSPRGLVVPVINDVDERSLAELAQRRRDLVQKVLDNEHTAADLDGGTFTLTNVGVFDMDVSYSIINPPEVAILAIGRRKQAPVKRNGGVQFETVVTFSLTIDHRVLDGADSGEFLAQLAEYAEHPGSVIDSVAKQ